MKKGWIILGVVVLVVGWFLVKGFGTYNMLVTQNETIDGKWAQVESQYQRRLDLVTSLISSVKGVLAQEQKVFQALADARASYAGAKTIDQKVAAAGQLEAGIGRLIAIVEQYPTLRSVEAVQTLMTEITGSENRISVERMRFNESVQVYNTSIQVFPTALFAPVFGFNERVYFEAASGAENAPVVDLTL